MVDFNLYSPQSLLWQLGHYRLRSDSEVRIYLHTAAHQWQYSLIGFCPLWSFSSSVPCQMELMLDRLDPAIPADLTASSSAALT